MNRSNAPTLPTRLIDLAVTIYAASLVLYPAAYRRDYGALMVQAFRDCARDAARHSGGIGVVRWALWAGLDLLASAFAERRRAPVRMSPVAVRQGLLLCLIAGGACFAIAGYSQLQPFTHNSFRGVYQVAISFICPAFLLLALGLAGLVWSVWPLSSPVVRLMACAACTGMTVAFASLVVGALIPGDEGWVWHLGMIGFVLHFAALGLFGGLALRPRLMPRWNVVPHVMGLAFFILLAFGPAGETYGPQWGQFLTFAGFGLGYALMGFGLWRAFTRNGSMSTATA